MLRHVVLFQWKEGATETEKRAVEEGLGGLPAAIPQLESYRFGRDAGLADGNHDFVVVADFASQADYEIYRDHPEHQRVIRELIRPAIRSRAGAQYEVG